MNFEISAVAVYTCTALAVGIAAVAYAIQTRNEAKRKRISRMRARLQENF
jgi:hypothetical protein